MDSISERIAYLLEAMDLSQEEFAAALSDQLKSSGQQPVTRGAVGNWVSGKKPGSTSQEAIAELTGVSLDWLVRNKGATPRRDLLKRLGAQIKGEAAMRSLEIETGGRYPMSVEVYGQAAGSTLGEGVSIMFELPPIGQLPLLPGLVGLKNVYGLEVTGESMREMFRPRDPVYVAPTLPVAKDDPVIIVERSSDNGNPRAFIKLFVADQKDRVVARQLYPPAEIEFMKRPGIEVHRVLTLREAIGYSGIEVPPQEPARPVFRRKR